MVQVDIFWAYGLGGSLAAAAGPKLVREEKPYASSYFVKTVLFLALIWAPTGLLLLLRHPSWETMQAAPSLTAMPPFLVLAFGITNVTQGILGFAAGRWLMARGKPHLAHLNWLAGYIGMFFILLYGWDGLGYDRFLYDRDMFGGVAWSAGSGLHAGPSFLISTVARTLYLDGVFLLPPLLYWFGKWTNEGSKGHSKSAVGAAVAYLGAVFFLALPTAALGAIATHFADRWLGPLLPSQIGHVAAYVLGIPLGFGCANLLLLRSGAPGHALMRRFFAESEVPKLGPTSTGSLVAGAG